MFTPSLSARSCAPRFLSVAAALALAATAAPAHAQCTQPPIINGTNNASDCSYTLLSTQTLNTTFGDANLAQTGFCNGSELDSISYRIFDNTLYLFIAGNLQSNFIKLELFFDSIPNAGQNRLRGDNPNVDGNGLNRMGFLNGSQQGLRFDLDFAADRWISLTGGNPGSGLYTLFANYSELLTNGGGTGYFLGDTPQTSTGDLLNGNNPFGIKATINNANTAGVGSGTGSGSGAGVATGVEMAIPLAALGISQLCGDLKICAFINDPGHAFISNQVLAPLPAGFGNLAEPRTTDFSAYAGDQFVTIPLGSSPSIDTAGQPSPATVCASQTATFTVAANSSAGPTYQWQFSDPAVTPPVWTDLSNGDWFNAGQRRAVVSGATSATLAVGDFYSGPDFTSVQVPVLLRCVVTNPCGSATSNDALLTVNAGPVLSAGQPADATICAGQQAAFAVTPSGAEPFTYQWQAEDLAAPGGWVNLTSGPFRRYQLSISGNTITVISELPALDDGNAVVDATRLRCIVTGACGEATSNPALLTVQFPPTIAASGQPFNAVSCRSGTATFSVTAAGADPRSFSWQIQDAAAPGGWRDLDDGPLAIAGVATCATVNGSRTPAVVFGFACTSGDNGVDGSAYRCVITNACGSITSNFATLTICPADFNCSGTVTVQDIFDFLSAYFASSTTADFNNSGTITVQDIFDFLAAYFAGC